MIGSDPSFSDRVQRQLLAVPAVARAVEAGLMSQPSVEIAPRETLRRGGRGMKRKIVDKRFDEGLSKWLSTDHRRKSSLSPLRFASRRVDEILSENDLSEVVRVKHLSYDQPEAVAFAAEKGFKVGTAKQVAAEAGIAFDHEAINCWCNTRKSEVGENVRPAELWTPELDQMLAVYEYEAENVGYLMTPVFAVNGEVKHHGSVPCK